MNKYGLPENHYSMPIEPIEFIQANDLPFAVGNVIKYVCRYKYKDGLKDLKKAKDYIEILIKDFQAKVVEEAMQDMGDISGMINAEKTGFLDAASYLSPEIIERLKKAKPTIAQGTLNDLGTLRKDVLIDDAIHGFKDNPIVDNPLPIMQTTSFKTPNPCAHKFEFKGLETANNYSSERLEKLEKILEKASPLPAQNVSFSRADMNRAKALKNSPCAACNLAECERDCEHNKLQPDAIANGWNKFIGEFCSIFQAVPLLLTMPVSFGVNTVVLHPQSFADTKEIMLYIHDLGERLNQFYNAEINLVVK